MKKVIIMGAAGRDFHNFNVYFKNNPQYHVVAFTAAQIPDIDGRLYPPILAGSRYPNGIQIYPEEQLRDLIRNNAVDLVAFSYSDITHSEIMNKASMVNAEGANFMLIGAAQTMLPSDKPVISVCAVRTGCGKSQTTRKICDILRGLGKKAVVIRHPMPYGDLSKQIVQRYSSYGDFAKHDCTIEEREEYEPLVEQGIVVYAGVDYEQILQNASYEADVIIWDGGNNDTPFYRPDLHIVIFDPHRPDHELFYYPGRTNMLMADIALINKVDSATFANIDKVRKNIETYAPEATIIEAKSSVLVTNASLIQGKQVMVVEDGPTLTHGGMTYGAGIIAARVHGASKIIDPHPFAVGTIADTFRKYPHIGSVLPAMGYSKEQINDMEQTINNSQADLVLFATPIQLTKIMSINKPALRVRYEYQDHTIPFLEEIVVDRLRKISSSVRFRGLFKI